MNLLTNTREDGFEQLMERVLIASAIEECRQQGITFAAEFADRQQPG